LPGSRLKKVDIAVDLGGGIFLQEIFSGNDAGRLIDSSKHLEPGKASEDLKIEGIATKPS